MFWQKSYRLEWYLIIWHYLNLYVYSISFIARHFLLWKLTGAKFNFETMFQQEWNLGIPAGILTLRDTWFRPFLDLHLYSNCWDHCFPNLLWPFYYTSIPFIHQYFVDFALPIHIKLIVQASVEWYFVGLKSCQLVTEDIVFLFKTRKTIAWSVTYTAVIQ